MKKTFTTLIFVIFCCSFFSQTNYFWTKQFSGAGAGNQPGGVTTDAFGNIYTIGSFTGTIDFDPGPGTFTMTSVVNDASAYIIKVDPVGNLVWAKQFISNSACWGHAITIDPSGNVLTTGYYTGICDFNPGPATNSLGAQNYDCFISKLDANGNYIWAKHFTGGGNEIGKGIACDVSGDVYTIGQYLGSCDFNPNPGTYTLPVVGSYDIFISKLTSTGTFVAAYSLAGASTDDGNYICVDASNNIYTAGLFMSTCDFNPGPGSYTLSSLGMNDIYVNKLDLNGNFLWAGQMGGINDDAVTGLGVDGSGNVITSGNFSLVVDLDPTMAVNNFTSLGGNDIFFSKLNSSGAYVWARQIGGTFGEESRGMCLDASGNVYGTGYFSGTVDFDPGPGVVTLTTSGNGNIFISKLNPSGNYSEALKMGGSSFGMGNAITLDINNSVISNGSFNAMVDFDPNAGVANLTSVSANDVYIHKLATCTLTPSQPVAINGPTILCANVMSTYTSSPVGGATGYMWAMPPGWTGISSNSTISATPGASGLFSVSATNSCGAGPIQTLSITVNALPSVSVSGNASICLGESATLTANGANTYSWNFGPTTSSIAVSPTTTTSYTVMGTSSLTSCSNTFSYTLVVDLCTGINPANGAPENTFLIYPNPTNGILNIESGTMKGDKTNSTTSVTITNTLGEILLNENVTSPYSSLNLSQFPNQIYFLKITRDNMQETIKLIKE